MNTDRTFTEALILIDEHKGRPAEHVHAGNLLAATSCIQRACRDEVPTLKIDVFVLCPDGGFRRCKWTADLVIPKPQYKITFEEVS